VWVPLRWGLQFWVHAAWCVGGRDASSHLSSPDPSVHHPPHREPSKAVQRVADADRPAEAFTTDRAVRSGRANAASGRILVNVPNDHFGPILPEHDPERGLVSAVTCPCSCGGCPSVATLANQLQLPTASDVFCMLQLLTSHIQSPHTWAPHVVV
jgi:hypothetical protein